MAELIERIMGLAPNGIDPAPRKEDDPVHCRIPEHEISALAFEITFGPRTKAQMVTYYSMNAEQSAELDAIAALINGTDAVKFRITYQIHSIFLLAGRRVPFYSTPAEVRARMGIP